MTIRAKCDYGTVCTDETSDERPVPGPVPVPVPVGWSGGARRDATLSRLDATDSVRLYWTTALSRVSALTSGGRGEHVYVRDQIMIE